MDPVTASLALAAKRYALGWLARHWPKLVAAGLVVIGGLVLLIVTSVAVVSGNSQTAAASDACADLGFDVPDALYRPNPLVATPTIPTGGTVAGFGPDDDAKVANARAIIAAGLTAGVGRRGLIVAIATALQESGLENLDHGDRDSLGLFQQRPSQGWGTAEQVTDPTYAALSFFGGTTSPHFDRSTGRTSPAGLLDVAGWESMPVTDAAQAVQRSAFPNAYAKHEERATIIIDALTGDAAAPSSPGPDAPTTEQTSMVTVADYRAAGVDIDSFCSSHFELAAATLPTSPSSDHLLPAGAWTAPLQARITSTFGMRFHPVYKEWRLHAGVDFHAAVGTPIVSPSVGVVQSVTWTSGGGLIVAIDHAGDVVTRHLHLSQALVKPGDDVEGGQTIALSGDSGVGTGAHYHYEVIVDGKPVDPEPFMVQHGVNLRAWS